MQINSHANPTPALLVTTAFWGVSLHFGLRADKRMKKAVWLRNRDMLDMLLRK